MEIFNINNVKAILVGIILEKSEIGTSQFDVSPGSDFLFKIHNLQMIPLAQ